MKNKFTALFFSLVFCFSFLSLGVAKGSSNFKQANNADFDKFGIGFGITIGIFYPDDVNQWLSNKYSGAIEYFGSTDLYMNEALSFVLTIRPIKMLRFNIAAEAGIGPKLVNLNGNYNYHNFGRYSFGGEALLNIPIASGRHSIIMGAGPYYHMMYFEEYKANSLGLRIVPFGMSFKFGGFQPQFQLGADLFAKATDSSNNYDPIGYSSYTEGFDLSYNGGFIKILILF